MATVFWLCRTDQLVGGAIGVTLVGIDEQQKAGLLPEAIHIGHTGHRPMVVRCVDGHWKEHQTGHQLEAHLVTTEMGRGGLLDGTHPWLDCWGQNGACRENRSETLTWHV